MNRKKIYPFSMIILPLTFFIIFFVLPATVGFLYAFTDWSSYVENVSFVGLKNFIEIIQNKSLLTAFENTLIFAGVKTVVVTFLGFVFAIPLNRKLHTTNALRTVYYLPAVLSTLVVGLIFNALFDSRHGTVNAILTGLGLDNLIFQWLGSRWPGVFTISLAEVWRNVGYAVVITLAGLQSVNSDYLEAARVDGAGGFQPFKNITLPLIMPIVNVNILFSLIYGLKMFDLVYVMTGGGPGHDTETFGTLMVNEMSRGRYAQSVAINLIFTIILVIVAVLYQKVSSRWENVE
ncbi:MAG: sugar ABC transporter permease [Lachnospiraceae bacterium]|jgi:raffinose/stachyose/melibiose transport system permease protein|nr:sugar ABC transporter permease [Lachnospiraceae bacterium]